MLLRKSFITLLAYNINLEGVEKVSVAVVNEELTVLVKETWEMSVPETEPEPEPTESKIVTEEAQ